MLAGFYLFNEALYSMCSIIPFDQAFKVTSSLLDALPDSGEKHLNPLNTLLNTLYGNVVICFGAF